MIDKIIKIQPDFKNKYLSKRHLFLKSLYDPIELSSSFGLKSAAQLGEIHSFDSSNLRLAKDGERVYDAGIYSTSQSSRLNSIQNQFNIGTTLIFEQLQNYVPKLEEISENINSVLQCNSHVNSYVVNRNSNGFGCHFDIHDVMILQISGCKKWTIWETPYYLPYPYENYSDLKPEIKEDLINGNKFELVLEAGDFLYLPRGFLHTVETQKESSEHLTFGLQFKSIYQTFEDLFLFNKIDKMIARSIFQYSGSTIFRKNFAATDFGILKKMNETYQKKKGQKNYIELTNLILPSPISPEQFTKNLTIASKINSRCYFKWCSKNLKFAYLTKTSLLLVAPYNRIEIPKSYLKHLLKISKGQTFKGIEIFPTDKKIANELIKILYKVGLITLEEQ